MFRCEMCDDVSAPGERPALITVEAADTVYREREYYKRGRRVYDPGGAGFEIVSQKRVCKACRSQFLHALADDIDSLTVEGRSGTTEAVKGLGQILRFNLANDATFLENRQ